MPCIPCAIAVLAADGPSIETLLADAKGADDGYSCEHDQGATHGADAPPCPPGSCPTCHAAAVTLAADPAFRAVAQKWPNAKMSLCADCRGRSRTRVYGDDFAGETAEDAYMSQGSDPQTAAQAQAAGLPASSSLSSAIALAQQAGTAAQYGISLAQQAGLIKGPNGQMVLPPAAQVQAHQAPPPAPKKDYTLYIALGAAAALVILYLVTLPPKGQGDGPGTPPSQPQFS